MKPVKNIRRGNIHANNGYMFNENKYITKL